MLSVLPPANLPCNLATHDVTMSSLHPREITFRRLDSFASSEDSSASPNYEHDYDVKPPQIFTSSQGMLFLHDYVNFIPIGLFYPEHCFIAISNNLDIAVSFQYQQIFNKSITNIFVHLRKIIYFIFRGISSDLTSSELTLTIFY